MGRYYAIVSIVTCSLSGLEKLLGVLMMCLR